MTNGELVSRVINNTRSLDKDGHISRRNVLSIARSKSSFYLVRDLNKRKQYRDSSLITHVPCLELEEIDTIKCPIIEFRTCNTVMKSREKLPEMIGSRYGDGIVYVTNLDGSKDYIPTTPKQFTTNKQRRFAGSVGNGMYYVLDNYLYLVNSKTEGVNLGVLSLVPEEFDAISGCDECESCDSVWDKEFIAPDNYLEIIIQETLNEILGSHKSLPEDSNPNLDENQKSQTSI